MKENTKFLRLKIPESLHKELKQLALDFGLPMNRVVADLVQKTISIRNEIQNKANKK